MHPTYPRLLRDRDNYRKWYLDEPVLIYLSDGHQARIPKGYRFDAHSVPLIFRWLFPKRDGHDIYAAMVHDYLVDVEMFHRFNRKFIDNEYTRFMNMPEYFTNKHRRYLMPRAVRLWGFLRWTLWGDYRGTPKPNTVIDIHVVE